MEIPVEADKTVRQWRRAEIHQGPGQSQRPIYRGRIYGCNRNHVITLKTPLHRGWVYIRKFPLTGRSCEGSSWCCDR